MTDLSKKLKYTVDNLDDVKAFTPRIIKKLRGEYNWDTIVDKYVAIYRDVAKKRAEIDKYPENHT